MCCYWKIIINDRSRRERLLPSNSRLLSNTSMSRRVLLYLYHSILLTNQLAPVITYIIAAINVVPSTSNLSLIIQKNKIQFVMLPRNQKVQNSVQKRCLLLALETPSTNIINQIKYYKYYLIRLGSRIQQCCGKMTS